MPALVPEESSPQPAEALSSQVDGGQLTSALEKLNDDRSIEPTAQPASIIEKAAPPSQDAIKPPANADKETKISDNPGDSDTWLATLEENFPTS